jgi:hypothetical protein
VIILLGRIGSDWEGFLIPVLTDFLVPRFPGLKFVAAGFARTDFLLAGFTGLKFVAAGFACTDFMLGVRVVGFWMNRFIGFMVVAFAFTDFTGFMVVAFAFTDFMLAGLLMTRIPEDDFIAARKTSHTQVLNCCS